MTGKLEDVEPLLVALTGDKGNPGLHSTVALIANASSGTWIRTDALAAPDNLVEIINLVRKPKSTARSEEPAELSVQRRQRLFHQDTSLTVASFITARPLR